MPTMRSISTFIWPGTPNRYSGKLQMTMSALVSFSRTQGTSSPLMKQLPSLRPQQLRHPRQGFMFSLSIKRYSVS